MRIKIRDSRDYYLTSDLHFYHGNVIKFSDRPFRDVTHMNESLIDNWNSVVGENDIVFNVGDMAFASEMKTVDLFYKLNGSQYFIYGNHDNQIRKTKKKRELMDSGKVLGFYDYLEVDYNQRAFLCLFHYAMRVWNRHHYGSLHCFGHSHGSLPGYGRSVDVGVDSTELNTNYAPIHIERVIDFLLAKQPSKVDHH